MTFLACGSTEGQANVIPSDAEAHLSVRLAPGQSAEEILQRVEAILLDATPGGVRMTIDTWSAMDGGAVPTDSPVIKCAQDAFRGRSA